MGGGGTTLDIAKTKGVGGLVGDVKELFSEDPEANLLLMGAPGGLRQTARDLGLTDEGPEAPELPDAANIPTEEQIQAQAKRKREFERIRRAGTQGRASTIKTGSRGAAGNIQTTFRQLSGR